MILIISNEWMNEWMNKKYIYMEHKNSLQNDTCSQRHVHTKALASFKKKSSKVHTTDVLHPQEPDGDINIRDDYTH